jgi:endonuclease/exonuclease/phosphatase (EEP) superfamily protein YafD
VTRLAEAVTIVCLGAMIAGRFLGGTWWPCDLLNHFWPHAGMLLGMAAVWLGFHRHWRAAGVASVALLWNLSGVVPYFGPRATPSGEPFRIVVCNLFSGNPTPNAALEFLDSTDADLLVLLEVDYDWMSRLKALREKYPYGKLVPQAGNSGIALLSRRSLADVEQSNFGLSGVPTVTAVVEEFDLRIVATHPPPPVGSRLAGHRDRQLADIAEFAAKSTRPVVVAGDLNATPWSSAFQTLVSQGNVRDSGLGRGIAGTWPTWTPWPLLPIDHVLISPTVGVRDRWVGPPVGSDHRPVIVDLVVPARPTTPLPTVE